MIPAELKMVPCPCGMGGCGKFIVEPLFGCQCSSVYKEQADELLKRWNTYQALVAVLKKAKPIVGAACAAAGATNSNQARRLREAVYDEIRRVLKEVV